MKVKGDGSDAIFVAEAMKFIAKKRQGAQAVSGPDLVRQPPRAAETVARRPQGRHGKAYYGEILGVDRSMGTLRRGLRRLGIADNTMLWFCSDNGAWVDEKDAPDKYGWNGGLRGHKGQLWEGGIRVPGIIEWPAESSRGADGRPRMHDGHLSDLGGPLAFEYPDQIRPLDGISIMPVINGQMRQRPQPIGFMHFGEHEMKDGAMARN